MQYELLRNVGIQHIQQLAGKLWTDYNSHDPGITMLEVMSFVLTDLGFRVNYDIKDIIAQQLKTADPRAIKNFYTACEILPNCPVTNNDFRKLLIDVEVVDETVADDDQDTCKYAGIKNAWINRSSNAEHEIFVNHGKSELSLDPVPSVSEQDSYYVKGLFDVLLEFDKCDQFGDLNANAIDEDLVIYEHASDPDIQGVTFNVNSEFPRWDDEKVNWNDPVNIQANIIKVIVKIFNLPDNYNLEAFITNKNEIVLKGNKDVSGTISAIADLQVIIDALNDFMYDPVEGLLAKYVAKINKIHEILHEVKCTLHANRNLCADCFRFTALKVEEILLCADIQIDAQADVEMVEAYIFYEVSKFLSPQVNFYTLEEMLNRCRNANQYTISEIKTFKRTFTINQKLKEDLNKDDVITVMDSGNVDGEYTVTCISENKENPELTDIQVVEEVTSLEFDESAYLFGGTIDENLCLTVDQIFEGPKLKHGFIDDDELEAARQMEFIHVSDLIRIIMDVEGVLAVKSIQIANRPLDNTDGIASKSVKWCLKLAMEYGYVPRLSIDDSKLTFFKDQLPFLSKREEVLEMLDLLENAERPQKIRYPKMDIPIPRGEYMKPEHYTSMMEEFPQAYGVGSKGILGLEALKGEARELRTTEVAQLKGFLMFFDQLMANYLSQIAHVKELFSMNGEKDKFGNYLIDKTYFSQPLYNVISHLDDLYVDKSGHLVKLQEIVEDQELYEERRNKFLDHLLGRFAESFSDYALLAYSIAGAKAPLELIGDKLNFLNQYPDLSKGRGKGLDYLSKCKSWHVDNVSGLNKRVSLLTGIESWEVEKLVFGSNFEIAQDGDLFKGIVKDDADVQVLTTLAFATIEEVKLKLELLLINGSCKENYLILEEDGAIFFEVRCEDELLASSIKTDFASTASGGDADLAIDAIIAILKREYLENHEANRHNLASPYMNYFDYQVTADMTPVAPEPPTFTITCTLYTQPFDFSPEFALMEGSITREAEVGDTEPQVIENGEDYASEAIWDLIKYGSGRSGYSLNPPAAPYTSPYKFVIMDRYGELIGQSIESDFNDQLANELSSLTSGEIQVSDSTLHDGNYTVTGASADGPFVKVGVDATLSTLEFDGVLSFTEEFAIVSIDTDERIIEIDADLSGKIEIDDAIKIDGSSSSDATYTILSLKTGGAGIYIGVRQPVLASDTLGNITYTKSFDITGINASQFIIKGNEDELAINEMIAFINLKFFSHEGMHLIEHVLLRPRINEKLFVVPEGNSLVNGLTDLGNLFFQKKVAVAEAGSSDNTYKVAGDLTGDIAIATKIQITGGSFNDGSYTISSISFDGANTVFAADAAINPVLFDVPDAPYPNGELIFIKKATISSIEPEYNKLIINDADALALTPGNVIQVYGSENGTNDNRFQVLSVADNAGSIEIVFEKIEQLIQDDLLPIHLDQDCETCKHTDPYSCVVSVVLPYWPGRFINLDFRKFMNKTIRLEGPAHVLFNICWINNEQMAEFEMKYKEWLLETGKEKQDKAALSEALGEFINILTRVRNVYPTGTLHDCEEDESLECAIILNNSVLGTF